MRANEPSVQPVAGLSPVGGFCAFKCSEPPETAASLTDHVDRKFQSGLRWLLCSWLVPTKVSCVDPVFSDNDRKFS
ncbi:hypothetical protein J2W42_006728 [Rhizobium tibeticum]|nr:hypothetical protein [Rhizobium tibeticum]